MTAKVHALPQPRILGARPKQPTSSCPAHCSPLPRTKDNLQKL